MKSIKIIISVVVALMLIPISHASVKAGELDKYISILQSNRFTLKYQDLNYIKREQNKDASSIDGNLSFWKSELQFFDIIQMGINQTEHCVVADGKNRYTEVAHGNYIVCKLQRGNEEYRFSKGPYAKIKKSIYKAKTGRSADVVSTVDTVAELRLGKDYGNSFIDRVFNGIMPPNNRSKEISEYKKVAEGNLENGQKYEDYKLESKGLNEVVRFYFEKGSLTKITGMMYWKNKNGKWATEKSIIKIQEFSPEPEQSLLTLPAEVKVDKKKKK